jgi:hypothetical protein
MAKNSWLMATRGGCAARPDDEQQDRERQDNLSGDIHAIGRLPEIGVALKERAEAEQCVRQRSAGGEGEVMTGLRCGGARTRSASARPFSDSRTNYGEKRNGDWLRPFGYRDHTHSYSNRRAE